MNINGMASCIVHTDLPLKRRMEMNTLGFNVFYITTRNRYEQRLLRKGQVQVVEQES